MRRTLTTIGVVATAVALLAACQLPDSLPAPDDLGAETTSTTSATGSTLDAFTPAPEGSMSGYSREEFPHWEQVDGTNNCDSRELLLKQQGTDVRVDGACEDTSGTWTSYYTGETIRDSSDVEADHVVPLAEAWRSGADEWTEQRREEFANDLDQIVISDGSSNSSKSDSDPAGWRPQPDRQCAYARLYTSTKADYKLTIDHAEHTALTDMLTTCH